MTVMKMISEMGNAHKRPEKSKSEEESYWIYNKQVQPSCIDDLALYPALRKVLKRIEGTGRYSNLILYGKPGTGKTTAARIIARLDCDSIDEFDFSGEKGVKSINEIQEYATRYSLFGGRRFVLDEFHDVPEINQRRLKKILEDTSTNRFIFCVNDITKIDDTILSRCRPLEFDFAELDEFDNVNVKDCTGWDGIDDFIKELKRCGNIIAGKAGKIITDDQFDRACVNPKHLVDVRMFMRALEDILIDDEWDADNS